MTVRPAAARGAEISQVITWRARLTAAGARAAAAAAASITTGKDQS